MTTGQILFAGSVTAAVTIGTVDHLIRSYLARRRRQRLDDTRVVDFTLWRQNRSRAAHPAGKGRVAR